MNDEVDLPFSLRFQVFDSSLGTAANLADDESDRIPRALEELGAPVMFEGRSRQFVLALPQDGVSQIANAVAGAIDRRVPVQAVVFDVATDEDGIQELVAKVRVNLEPDQALQLWEELGSQILRERGRLSDAAKRKMNEEFALFVRWNDRV